MSETGDGGPVDRDVGRLCSHCGFPLPKYDSGLRHYGTHVAHQENECLRLLHAELDRLRAENEALRKRLKAFPGSEGNDGRGKRPAPLTRNSR